jgi:oxazoline/thiazoline synthase
MAVLHRPAYDPRWRVRLVRGEAVFFTSERDCDVLSGQAFQRIAPLINGRRTADEIVSALPGRSVEKMATAYYALHELTRRGCIQEAEQAKRGIRAGEAKRSLRRLVGNSVRIVLTTDYLHPRLARVNRSALRRGRAWMPAKIVGREIWAGPVFLPGETGCWSCLAHRLRVMRPIDVFVARRARKSTVLAEPARVSRRELRAFVKKVRAAPGVLRDAVLTFDLDSHSVQRHPVVRRPQCPDCGDAGLYARQIASFQSPRPRKSLVTPTTAALVSHVSGLTAEIVPTRGDFPRGIHSYGAGPSWAAPPTSLTMVRMALQIRSAGTARTRAEAGRSALGEVVERYSASAQGDEPVVRSSLARLGPRAIHPNTCMLFSEAQYDASREWNARSDAMCGVPARFDADAVIDWTPLWSLMAREHRFLPTTLLYHGARRPGCSMCSADSSGTAAGRTHADAIVGAFLELVERDSIALWWYNRVSRSRLALDTLDDSHCTRLARALWRSGREAWILDITSDLGVPTYAAVSRRRDSKTEEILMGFGAHFDPERAARHAMHEMAQTIPSTNALTRERNAPTPLFAEWIRSASLEAHTFLAGNGASAAARRFPVEGDELTTCVRIAQHAKLELLVLDQTRPDIGVPVTRVVVPGLRPATARLAPGRLYEIPVRMGWRPNAIAESELNPVPFFL